MGKQNSSSSTGSVVRFLQWLRSASGALAALALSLGLLALSIYLTACSNTGHSRVVVLGERVHSSQSDAWITVKNNEPGTFLGNLKVENGPALTTLSDRTDPDSQRVPVELPFGPAEYSFGVDFVREDGGPVELRADVFDLRTGAYLDVAVKRIYIRGRDRYYGSGYPRGTQIETWIVDRRDFASNMSGGQSSYFR